MRNLIILLGGFALIGCGGSSLCKRLADDAAACDVETSDEDMDQCEEQLSKCSAEDEKLLNDFFDCMDEAGFGVCDEAPTGTSAFEDMAACSLDAAAISEECQASFVGSTGSGS